MNKLARFDLLGILIAIPLGVMLVCIGLFAFLFFSITSVLCFIIVIIQRKRGFRKIPLIVPALVIFFVVITIFLDYSIILLFGGFTLLVAGVIHSRNRSAPSRTIYLLICGGIITFVTGILLIDPSNLEATFYAENANFNVEYSKFDEQPYDSFTEPVYDRDLIEDGVYRSMVVIGVRTDSFGEGDPHVVNYDQAYFNVTLNITEFIPETTTKFWNISLRARVINYDSTAREYIEERGLVGYDLFNNLKDLQDLGVLYYYAEYYNNSKLLSFNIDYVRMATYIIALDIVILPRTENSELYTTWDVESFEASMGYNITGGLHYDLTTEREGYAFIIKNLMPTKEAGNLFDEMVSVDVFNFAILFFLIFFITLLISIIQRNLKLVKMMNLLLLALFALGLFATIATAMANVPFWLSIIFSGRSGQYIWGIVEAVKYAVVMGTVLGIIFIVANYITQGLSSAMEGSEEGG